MEFIAVSLLPKIDSAETIGYFILELYRWSVGLVGLAILIQVIRAGLKYFLAAGDSSKGAEARKLVTSAIIGAILLVSSVLILRTINPALTDLSRDPFSKLATKGVVVVLPSSDDISQMTPETNALVEELKLACQCDSVLIKYEKTEGGEFVSFSSSDEDSFGRPYGMNNMYERIKSKATIISDDEYDDPRDGQPYRRIRWEDEQGNIYDTIEGCALFKCDGDDVKVITVRNPS